MKIYIASFFDTRARLIPHARRLEAAGHEITSDWLYEAENAFYGTVTDGYRLACGLGDLQGIKDASLVLLDTIDQTPRGGREVEFGVALGHGIPVIRIGPERNVFHKLVFKSFATWGEALPEIEAIHRRHA